MLSFGNLLVKCSTHSGLDNNDTEKLLRLTIKIYHQSLPLAQIFRISRGAKTRAEVIVVVLSDGSNFGWGESVPYGRYGESIETVTKQLADVSTKLTSIDVLEDIHNLLPAGSARNALDCALWDLKSKLLGQPVSSLLALPVVDSCITAQTLSVDTTEAMRKAAVKLASAPLIKVKLDAQNVLEKMQAIHQVCSKSRFIIDANEGWDINTLEQIVEPLVKLNVVLIEQPLPADSDDDLLGFESPITLCADESCHGVDGLKRLVGKYAAINIKLDKTGGLTEAVKLLREARERDFQIMVGCMVGSSLAMAPAYTLCGYADYVDLDGPLLVAQDRANRFVIENGVMSGLPEGLWGTGRADVQDPELVQFANADSTASSAPSI